MGSLLLWLVLREEKLVARGKVPLGRLRRLWFKAERRRSPRYRVDWNVSYRRAQTETQAGASPRDVSQTGAGLTVKEKLPLGALLQLEIELPEVAAPLLVIAEVVWIKEVLQAAEKESAGRLFFIGVHFQNLEPDLEKIIARALRSGTEI